MKPATIPTKDRPVSALKITSWVSNFGINYLAMNEDNFDAGKEKADHETVETNASACRKRDQLPRDCGRAGNSTQYGAG
ncbi:MAG: hypothetical protein E5X58_07030 [Mesorhizobium sp.]|nr:MAG: hypothetical protein E5X58_07030 [Mesorhizobium sp.]